MFANNFATPLSLSVIFVLVAWYPPYLSTTFKGKVVFENNSGVTGGGIYIAGNVTLDIADNACLSFINNNAIYGGAIYVGSSHKVIRGCFISGAKGMFVQGNTATIGPVIYSAINSCALYCQDLTNIASPPTSLSGDTSVTVFPGQTIMLNMTVTDCYGNNTACEADALLTCGYGTCSKYGIGLEGSPTSFLTSGLINTGLSINSAHDAQPSTTPSLIFTCKASTKILSITKGVMVVIDRCPVGLVLESQKCVCTDINGNKAFACSNSSGKACVRRGYWYGIVNGIITVSQCHDLFCDLSASRSVCPSDVVPDSTNYILLDQSLDDQCLDGHGGPLCTGCAEGKVATYDILQCISTHRCEAWHPYIIILLYIVCPLTIGVLLLFVIQLKLGIGSGYLYGPIFYLAVLNRIPLDVSAPMSVFISVVTEGVLLNMKVLGFIPLCFFNISPLYIRCFKLLPPLVILLLVLFIAKCAPRLFQRLFRKLPTEGICSLIVISFWSLASTSIEIITPVYLSQVTGARVYFSPDLAYLSTGGHIAVWIVATLILIMLCGVTILLMISPFVSTFHRIKPILDEFQSCYKDQYRWYGGVYFVSWIVLQALLIVPDYLIFQTLLLMLTVAQISILPYCRRWLNIMNTVLLIGLLFTSSLTLAADNSNEKTVLVYLSVLVPLVYLAVGTLVIVLIRVGVVSRIKRHLVSLWREMRRRTTTQAPQRSRVREIQCYVPEEREPLIGMLQDDEQ